MAYKKNISGTVGYQTNTPGGNRGGKVQLRFYSGLKHLRGAKDGGVGATASCGWTARAGGARRRRRVDGYLLLDRTWRGCCWVDWTWKGGDGDGEARELCQLHPSRPTLEGPFLIRCKRIDALCYVFLVFEWKCVFSNKKPTGRFARLRVEPGAPPWKAGSTPASPKAWSSPLGTEPRRLTERV